jgi:hypothetical protein
MSQRELWPYFAEREVESVCFEEGVVVVNERATAIKHA